MGFRIPLPSMLTIVIQLAAATVATSLAFAQQDFDHDGVPDVSDSCFADPNPSQTDTDSDGIGDACDNCSSKANSAPDAGGNVQLDFDADGYGNLCDPDFDGNGLVGVSDWLLLASKFGRTFTDPLYDPKADLNGDGVIGGPDWLILASSFGGAPGPSGFPCAGSAPCVSATPSSGHQPLFNLLTLTSDPPTPPPVPTCAVPDPFYEVGGAVVFHSVTPIDFGSLQVFLNDARVPPTGVVQVSAVSFRVLALLGGVNAFLISANATNTLPIEANLRLWAGSDTQGVSILDEVGNAISGASVLIRFVNEPTLVVTCLTDANGLVRFDSLPNDGSFSIEATTPTGQILTGTFAATGAFSASTQPDPMVLQLKPPLSPSPINNNDFSQGLAGWEISDPTHVELVPHQE